MRADANGDEPLDDFKLPLPYSCVKQIQTVLCTCETKTETISERKKCKL